MGYGLIKILNNEMSFMLLNELNLKKLNDHYLKLNHIFNRTVEIIDNYNPDEIAIEAPFWKKCPIHVKVRKSPRSSYGCWLVKTNPDN